MKMQRRVMIFWNFLSFTYVYESKAYCTEKQNTDTAENKHFDSKEFRLNLSRPDDL